MRVNTQVLGSSFGYSEDMDDGGTVLLVVVALLALGFIYGTYARYRGTRGAISERPREARGRTGAEGRSGHEVGLRAGDDDAGGER